MPGARHAAARPAADNPEAYIAGDRRRALAAGVEMPDRVQGAAIFADISGFTPLTEALAAELGPQRGAEELTAALSVVFSAVLGELHRFGGSVIYFSGDAVTCWIDGDDGLLATACGLAMQRAMASVATVETPGGSAVELGMKVAVAAGPARRFVVGDPDIQLIDVLAGSLMDRLAEAEHLAAKGEVLVDGRTLDALGELLEVAAVRGEATGRAAVVTRLLVDTGPLPSPEPYPKLRRAVVRQWLLPAVYERMRTGRGVFLSELRPAVPMFVRFGGIDYDAQEEAPRLLDEFIRRAQWAIDSHGGNLLQLTIGDKGAYLYAVFGSPHAHEDDAARACGAALDVLALEGETAATGLQIGLAAGRLRSGTYGHRQRRTFCCLGDAVNLSARLMAAAPGGTVYVTPRVAAAAEGRFCFEGIGDLTVKGKAAPVAVSRLTGSAGPAQRRQERRRHMVGRSAELERLVVLAERATAGRGQVVSLVAEAGMGKSTIVDVLATVLEDRDVPVHVGAAAGIGSATSYLVWRRIWSALLGVTPDATPGDRLLAQIEAALGSADPALVPRAPLVGAVLGVELPDNDLTRGFDAELRKTSVESLLVQYLSRLAAQRPVAMVLEDCHWIDALSADLLDLVSRAVAALPVLVVLTSRPGSFGAPERPHSTVVELRELDEDSCRTILAARLGELYGTDARPSEALLDRLVGRAEGNPFYLEELANYLHDAGADPSDPASAGVELPSSLASLVLSRVDTLAESPRRTLKVASVVGREFSLGTLTGSYPELGSARHVVAQLRKLCAEDLVLHEDPSSDVYSFRHSVIREVTYESLPFALRATIHGRVGAWLELSSPGSLDLLAHHFWHGHDEAKKRQYLRRAGEAAAARFANEAAADYLQRLVPLVAGGEKRDALDQLGAVLEVRGDWTGAEVVYRQLIELAEDLEDPGAVASARVSVCAPMMNHGRYSAAAAELDVAQRLFEEAGDLAGLALVTHVRGRIANQTGDPAAAWDRFQRSLEVRKALGDTRGMAMTLNNLAVSAGHRGDYEVAWELFEQTLALRKEIGDLRYMGMTHNNLGVIASYQGDYERAIPHLEEAVRLATEIDCPLTTATARQSLGNCLRELGKAADARDHYRYALDAYAIAGDQIELCSLLEDVAMVCAVTRPADALALIGAADALREAIGSPRMEHQEAQLERHRRRVRERLGEDAVDPAAAGRALGLDGAVSLCRALCDV